MRLKTYQKILSVLDSWGKLPSGVFSGNFYEFGDFAECLNIHRNGTLYKAQYCLEELILQLDGFTPASRSNEFNVNNFNIPNVFQTENNPLITPRMAMTP